MLYPSGSYSMPYGEFCFTTVVTRNDKFSNVVVQPSHRDRTVLCEVMKRGDEPAEVVFGDVRALNAKQAQMMAHALRAGASWARKFDRGE